MIGDVKGGRDIPRSGTARSRGASGPESSPPAFSNSNKRPATPDSTIATDSNVATIPTTVASLPSTGDATEAGATDSTTTTTTTSATVTNSVEATATRETIALGFSDGLDDWQVWAVGGTDEGSGSVVPGSALLTEGDSFVVGLSQSFTVPEVNPVLQFTFTDLDFDTTDPDSINDAFEAALVDEQGNPIVHPIRPAQDAFFNITEGEPAALSAETMLTPGTIQTVTVDLSDIPAGTQATLQFRLVNNDSDTTTRVRILDVFLPGSENNPPQATISLTNDTAPAGEELGPLGTDLLSNDSRVQGTVSDDQGITKLEASIDDGAYMEITSALAGGTYAFDPGALSAGPHRITIRVTDTGGQTGEASLDFQVNRLPVADAGGNRTIDEGDTALFDGSASSDIEAPLYAHNWTFDDATSFSGVTASRHYLEDGLYPVKLQVTDTAGSTAEDNIEVTVGNLPAVIDPVSQLTIGEGRELTFSTTFADPGVLDTHWGSIDWGDSSSMEPASISESDGAGTVSGSHTYADNGTYLVTVSVTDDEGDSSSTNFAVVVENVRPSVAVSPSTQSRQYSDALAPITVVASDVPSDTLSVATSYQVNGGPSMPGLPNGLLLTGAGGAGSGNWAISGIADVAPGTYTIHVTVSDEDGAATEADVIVTVEQEDAAVVYSGVPFVSTSSVNDTTAIVPLRATIQDISLVDGTDTHPGDIRHATVSFVNRDTGEIIASGLSVVPFNPADPTSGVATYDWAVDLKHADSASFTIGIIVDGWYVRNNSADDAVVTVSKPQPNSITGGGYFINESSAGLYAGDPGLRTNLGFNVKFNKQLTKLQGHVNIIVRQHDRVYQIKSNATDSLSLDPYIDRGVFTSKANLRDISDPNNEISLGGNLLLEMSVTDRGEPGRYDSLAISVWRGEELFYASRWNGTQSIEQLLDGGNLQVRRAVSTPRSEEAAATKFFVVDGGADSVFRYGPDGAETGAYGLPSAASDPRGATSDVTGGTVWVVDASGAVIVQSPDGAHRGSWMPQGVTAPEGITTDGVDIWIVDDAIDSVSFYAGAALFTSGAVAASGGFSLHADNQNPSGLATDGSRVWVTDDERDEVFVYGMAGDLQGRWLLDLENGDPQGITNEPGGGTDLWIVDNYNSVVYRYHEASLHLAGAFSAGDSFALDNDNTQAKGIADPPDSLSIEVKWQRGDFGGDSSGAFSVLPDSNQVMMTPVVIDLDGDSISEVVFSTFRRGQASGSNAPGVLRALRGDTGEEVWTNTNVNIAAYSGIAAGDIDLDGRPEIVATDGGRLLAFEHDGSLKWSSDPMPYVVSLGSASIANIDGVGPPEIIVGGTVLNNDGSVRWSRLLGQGTNHVRSGPLSAVADIDLDGTLEVIAGNTIYNRMGDVKQQFAAPDGFVALGNFDNDRFAEIVLVAQGAVYLFNHDDAAPVWTAAIPGGGLGGAPTVADIDGDGLPDITVAGASRYIALSGAGELMWEFATQDVSSQQTGSSVFDLDGDGSAEVLYGDETAFYILRGNDGHVLAQLERGSGTTYELPVVADIDDNSSAEIVVVANDYYRGTSAGLMVLSGADAPWSDTRPIWNQHTYHITNVNDDGTIPEIELASWELYNNYRRNQQITGTEIFPPTISAAAPAHSVTAGTTILISGHAQSDGYFSNGAANRITLVSVNGSPVDVLDTAGNFFAQVTVLPGQNTFTFTAIDTVGQSASTVVQLIGTTDTQADSLFDIVSDVSGSLVGEYGRTSFTDERDLLFADLAIRNAGSYPVDAPLLVGITNLSDLTVRVRGFDGISPDGIPYYDFGTAVQDGVLAPGEVTATQTISFYNPNRGQFSYDLVFLGKLNESPQITSVPDVEGRAGRDYSYDVDANDSDGDPLAYSLTVAPAGMLVDSNSGLITWPATHVVEGTHSVTVRVEDGRGGSTEQSYLLTAIQPPPNRPPIMTSVPVVSATVGQNYAYDANATDADDDFLAYELRNAPVGMTIDPQSGNVAWEPTSAQLGIANVEIAVSDGRGGIGIQQYAVTIGAMPGNRSPIIISDPQRVAVEGEPYFYDVDALDPEGDQIIYSMQNPTVGMTIDQDSGMLRWPEPTTGVVEVTVVAMDSNGGRREQSFAIDVSAKIDGELVLSDLDTNGLSYDGQALHVDGIVTAVVVNEGTNSINVPIQAVFFQDLDFNGLFDRTIDAVLGSTFIDGPLAPGQNVNVEATIIGTVRFVDDVIFGVVDAANVVREANERNNYARHECIFVPEQGTFAPVVEWSHSDGDDVTTTPLVADLTGDSLPEVIYHLDRAGLRVISGVDGSEVWANTTYSLREYSHMAVGDIDSDGRPEIIAVDTSDLLVAYEHDGTVKWRSTTRPWSGINWGGPSIADIDNDGVPEIVVGSSVYNNDGTIRWQGNAVGGTGAARSFSGPMSTVADLDLDGIPEVVAGNSAYHADGSLYWNAPINDGLPAVANFDDDAWPEIVVIAAGRAHLLEHDGTVKWITGFLPGVSWPGGAPTVGDFDADGKPEIGVAMSTRYVVLETDGTVKWTAPTNDRSSGMTGSTLFDFEGDGSVEVVYGDEYAIRIYDGRDGTELFSYARAHGTGYEMPVVADVDADGNAEIVFSAMTRTGFPAPGIYVIGDANDSWVPTRRIWNQHSYHVTNVNEDGTIPQFETNSWDVHNTYRLNLQPGVNPQAAPDLTASFVRVQQSVSAATVTTRIGNGGEVLVPPAVSVTLYDGDPANGGVGLATTQTSQRLEPGQFEDVSVVLTDITNRDLWVVVDEENRHNECDEFNNIYHFVDSRNRTPEIVSTPPEAMSVGDLFRYEVSTFDADFDPLTYGLLVKPNGMVIDQTAGVVAWIPTVDQIGSHNVTLRVRDGRGGVDLQSFQITVTNNHGPLITSLPPQPALDGLPYQYRVKAQDADGDAITYRLDGAPSGMTIDADSGVLNWALPTLGTHEVIVVANDGEGGQATQSFALSVVESAPNDPPSITSVPRETAVIGQLYRYRVGASDPNGDPITFLLDEAPAGVTLSPNGVLDWVPTQTQLGSHSIRLRVDDGRGGEATQEFTIQAVTTFVNEAPQIVSNPVSTVVSEHPYLYDATAIDPDGDLLVWQLAFAPDGMSIDAELGRVRWTPRADQLGFHDVVVQVFDGQGGIGSQSFAVDVRSVNTPPQITSTPATEAFVGNQYVYAVRAKDIDGDSLTFVLSGPPSMTIDAASGLIQWTPSASDTGTHTITVAVSDGQEIVRQTFDLAVIDQVPNSWPIINSTPSFLATIGEPYTYEITAVDPDGDPMTLALSGGPAGMALVSGSIIEWTPAAGQEGPHTVTILASDNRGGVGGQQYTLLAATNTPPTIVSSPPLAVSAGAAYRYDVRFQDAEGDRGVFELALAPAGMTIDNLGRVEWAPAVADLGTHTVEVVVTDGRGGEDRQSFTLDVTSDQMPPQVLITLSQNPATLGQPVGVVVNAVDDVGVESLVLTVDGLPVVLDLTGRATLAADAAGQFELVATAADAGGNSALTTVQLLVLDPNDTSGPQVSFTTPTYGQVIEGPVDVIGTVSDDNLISYTLSYAPFEGGQFIEIASGTSSVTEGVLGRFDPSTLPNDSYFLQLEALDAGGNRTVEQIIVGVAGELKIGNFTLSFTDLSIPVSGIPIVVARTYDSLNTRFEGDFGHNWRLEFGDTDVRTSVAKTGLEDLWQYNPFYDGARIYVTLPGGKREGFTFRLTPAPGLVNAFLSIYGGAYYIGSFEPDPGVTSTLTTREFILRDNGFGEAYEYAGYPWNPFSPQFGGTITLTTKEGIAYTIEGDTGDLQQVADRNGNTLSFTETGVTSSTGQSVTFERDPQGRITAVVDPNGERIEYEYDVHGDLIAVTDREGNTTRMFYDEPNWPHFLTEVRDPLGRTGVRTEYDEAGRLIKMIDADGQTIELVHDPNNFIDTVKNQLGFATTYEYDSRGNVITEIDPEGGITRRTYDDPYDPTLETSVTQVLADGIELTTQFTYDAKGNVLTETDPLGRRTLNTYDSFGNVLTTTDPLGNTTTNVYDASGNLLSITDAAGQVTSFTYDAAGNPLTMSLPGGNTQAFVYDSLGNVLQQTDALGNTTTFTYDASGNQLTETRSQTLLDGSTRTILNETEYDASGRARFSRTYENGVLVRETETQYDAVGNRITEIDPLGRTTRFIYDDRGLLTETILPDDTPADDSDNPRTRTEYDAAGQTIAEIDQLGRRTEFLYDKAGRQTAIILPDDTPADDADNPRTVTEYDLAGRTVAQVDARGNRTEFVLDAAGQQIELILPDNTPADPTDNPRLLTEYDVAGRSVSQTDPLGSVTRFEYDDAGRPVKTIFNDGSSTQSVFDDAGRLAGRLDQNGIETGYEYDALGRLTAVIQSVTDFTGAFKQLRTEYEYDDLGNFVVQRDALGRETRFEYDGQGRRTATILPDDTPGTLADNLRSTTTYNADGSVASTTDFNGDTILFEYDAKGQLTKKDFPSGPDVTFTYTPTGRRASVTDGRGLTQFAYDAQNRLLRRTDPDGSTIEYTYDAAGNRTSVTTTVSGNAQRKTVYTFDAQNRQETVTDPEGGLTEYSYDLAGRLTRTNLPNGTYETRDYDALGRLLAVESFGPGNAILAGFHYDLDAAGNRTQITEETSDGFRVVDYSYDELYRLTRETMYEDVADPADLASETADRVIAYEYDDVGNRLSRNDSAEGVTTYTYDPMDRLLDEVLTELAGDVVESTYGYDNNGNTTSKVTTRNGVLEDQVFYDWDVENRLVAADTDGDGTPDVAYQYDGDGIRVSQTLDPAGVADETRFLIDANRPYAQVLEEYTPGGIIKVSYVFGNDLISQNRHGDTGKSFYHVDGLGSTRVLTDSNGILSNEYIYDAFGRLVHESDALANVFLFAGEQRDSETGLDYLRVGGWTQHPGGLPVATASKAR